MYTNVGYTGNGPGKRYQPYERQHQQVYEQPPIHLPVYAQPQLSPNDSFTGTADLNNYFRDKVQLQRTEIKMSKQVTLEIVNMILDLVSQIDPRFKPNPISVGSYWSGLKVGKPDEFNVSVALNIPETFSLTATPYTPATEYAYTYTYDGVTYGVPMVPQPAPHTAGNCKVMYYGGNTIWQSHCTPQLTQDNYLISKYVKDAFRNCLELAVSYLRNTKGYQVCMPSQEAGPAISINMARLDSRNTEQPNSPRPISVDFTPTIQARVPFPSSIAWPHPGKAWPSMEKVAKIKEIGINAVPKKDWEWYLSFGECEKELTKQMDKEGENTNRKALHRIMKKLTEDLWSPENPNMPNSKPVLSSYILKNVLFWECETFPSSRDWQNDVVWERFQSLTSRLLQALQSHHLQLYFCPEVNLLQGKDPAQLVTVINNILVFLQNPTYFLQTTFVCSAQ